MSSFEQRRAALDFSMRHVGDNADLSAIFTTADKFDAYLSGQKTPVPPISAPAYVDEIVRCNDDPRYFAERFPIQHPVKGIVPFNLYPFQKETLDFVHTNRFTHVKSARQMGITTLMASYMLWTAMYRPDQTIMLMSPKFMHSVEVLNRIRFGLDNLPAHLKIKTVVNNKDVIEFENGSRIYGRHADSVGVKGMALTHLFLQDLAWVSHRKADDLWQSVFPVVAASKAKICMFGGVNAAAGLFYEVDRGMPENGFVGIDLPWHWHPERRATWAQEFRTNLGERRFRAEFECQYIASTGGEA